MNELTRAELIEMICPTDATYDCNQGNCSSSCDKCEDILNYLIDRYDAKVRADVIAEFREKIYEKINYYSGYPNCSEYDYAYEIALSDARNICGKIAEQMMEGKNDKRSYK